MSSEASKKLVGQITADFGSTSTETDNPGEADGGPDPHVVYSSCAMGKARLKDKCFPFLKLPAEIRNKIYSLVLFHLLKRDWHPECDHWHSAERCPGSTKGGNILVFEKPIPRLATVHMPPPSGPRLRRPEWLAPNLLQVSLQIRAEASAIHYAIKNFTVIIRDMDFSPFYAWLKMIRNHNKLIKSITFLFENLGKMDFSKFLKTKIKYLAPSCRFHSYGRWYMVRYFRDGIKAVEHLRSLGLSSQQTIGVMEKTGAMMSWAHVDCYDMVFQLYCCHQDEDDTDTEWDRVSECETCDALDEEYGPSGGETQA